MLKIWYIHKKEILLLVRDIPGLIILFVMPVLLIFIVVIAQENVVKSQAAATKILFIDEAGTEFSLQLLKNFDSSGYILPVTQINNEPLTLKIAQSLINTGDYKFGVVIPPANAPIIILIDPVLHETFRKSVTNSLTYIIKGSQAKVAMNGILGNLPEKMQPLIREMIGKSLKSLQPVIESYARKDKATILPNVIQNNVPGFILFAMFFIVIPLSGSLITEKNEGSFQRLRSLPIGLSVIIGGKVLVYLAVCFLQFILMMFVGSWIFPYFFGLPGLIIDNQYFAIAIATVAASLAAVGFGVITGSAASSHNQAALFGSVMVVMLGVISGTFFPVHLMPKAVQIVSHFSPIRWGIDNYLNLFVREGDIISILPNSILLILFFGLAMIISIVIFAKPK
ncbi:MAG: ABC transporter permease [Bacteroidota bacterium]